MDPVTDARTEARRRLATAMRYRSARSNFPGDALEWGTVEDLADAVLELFEQVSFDLVVKPAPGRQAMRQLVMFGPVEPVIEEASP